LLNSDDVFHPQRLEQCLRVLAADATCQLVTTGLALIDRDSKRLTTSNVSRLADGDSVHSWVHWFARTQPSSVSRAQLFSELLRRNFLVTSSNIVCRTDWLRGKAGSLQSLKYCVDWQLFLDAASEGVLVHIPDELLGYRLHDSNTVWFNPGRRWAYTLEVSRVAARAVQGYVESLPQEAEARITAVLQLVSDHLLANTEVDGLDLYLNQLLEGPLLERLEGASKTVRALLEKIEHQRRRTVEPDPGQQVRNEARSALMVALRDTVQQFQGQQKSWVDTEAWLRTRIVEEEGKLRHAEWQHQELRAGLEAEMHSRAERIARLVDEAAGLEKARAALRKQLADAVVKRDAFERDANSAREMLTAATLRIEQLEAGNKSLEGELTTAVQHGRRLGDELDARTEALAMARAVHRLAQATDKTELQLGRWLWRHGGRRVAKWRQKLQSLLAAMGHRVHRLLHRSRPIVLLTADPAAVAAEPALLARCLTDVGAAGAEPIVFSFGREVAALAAPNRSRTLLSLPEHHAADLRFWGQRHGQRLESMLASITAATGAPREAVLSLAEMQRALGLARSAAALRSPLAAAPSFGAALEARVTAWLRNTPWCLWLDHLPLAAKGLDVWIVSELPTAALLTVTSPALADALVARGVPRERLVIAYAPATTSTPASVDRGRLLSSRVAAGSDVSLLLTAVQEVVRRGCECSVELVSPRAPDLDAMAAEERVRLQIDRAGLGHRITLQTGGPAAVGRPMAWVAAVSPAAAEQMRVPPGLLDAVASGLPIVASDVACLRGLLADGVDAILVAPGDAAAMADALQRVLESADLRSALGSSAMARHAATLRAGGSGHVVGARLKTLLTSIP
jgi:predicted  nucleic acid-binding Zn-ribbon protein